MGNLFWNGGSHFSEANTFLLGKRYPNKIFVGGLPPLTTAEELANFFANFGHVVESKVIFDHDGISKGYGFVSFRSQEDVSCVKAMGTLFLRNKKLNLGPAVKKELASNIPPETVIVPNAPSKGVYYYPQAMNQYVYYQMPQQANPTPGYYYAVQGDTVFWYPATSPATMQYNQEQCTACQVEPEQRPKKKRNPLPPRFRRNRSQ
ncbi:deleted in azoospermia protein 1 isoform X2 [Nematostella vectensis]|uniref:deleted in azoospermia protein 1 isoform X2 n=1 Tax=Nematostella vectensis TaxID=45351 RepID=UPI0013901521|nr:deleted in azoospermia protein 1 isoform X2 [Nematostella vectensis]